MSTNDEMKEYLQDNGWRYDKTFYRWKKKGVEGLKIILVDYMAMVVKEQIINADNLKQLQSAITELTNKSK